MGIREWPNNFANMRALIRITGQMATFSYLTATAFSEAKTVKACATAPRKGKKLLQRSPESRRTKIKNIIGRGEPIPQTSLSNCKFPQKKLNSTSDNTQ